MNIDFFARLRLFVNVGQETCRSKYLQHVELFVVLEVIKLRSFARSFRIVIQ